MVTPSFVRYRQARLIRDLLISPPRQQGSYHPLLARRALAQGIDRVDLCQNIFDHVTGHVGEAKIAAAISVREPFVVDAE